MRSRFSVSRKAKLNEAGSFKIGDVMRLISAFDRCYRMATDAVLNENTLLRHGPKVREQTFGKLKIHLGDDIAAASCLTIWDFPDREATAMPEDDEAFPPPRIVEFSYKVSLDENPWSEDAARRILRLFLELQTQESMPSKLKFTSKTEFALPPKL